MNNLWLLLDSNYLCHRAKWAMGNLMYEGKPTGVIYGFLQTVLQLQRQFKTSNIAFCFDSRSSLRKKAYPEYKAHRKQYQILTEKEQLWENEFRKQIQLLRKSYLPMIGFNNIFIQKGYESDDLLAKLALDITKGDVAIITADEDLFQCINKNVFVYNPQKKLYMTYQRFYNYYGIKPWEWRLVKALAGCASDNIKGLHGIGEKTALKWIQGTLTNTNSKAYKTLDSQESASVFNFNYPLVKLPLKGTKNMQLQNDNISKDGWQYVCNKLGFKTLLGKRNEKRSK
jgi:DNA polymerase-1